MNLPTNAIAQELPLLIVPGLSNSGPGHWQTLFESTYPNSRRVIQESWDSPELTPWLERLYQSIEAAPGSILVAHSLGCILVAHAMSQRPNLPVSGAMLVAPADIETRKHLLPELPAFAPIPKRPLRIPSVVVGSRNDIYISLDRAKYLAARWNSRFIDLGLSGHINTSSGHGEWPLGHEILSALSREVSHIASTETLVKQYG